MPSALRAHIELKKKTQRRGARFQMSSLDHFRSFSSTLNPISLKTKELQAKQNSDIFTKKIRNKNIGPFSASTYTWNSEDDFLNIYI